MPSAAHPIRSFQDCQKDRSKDSSRQKTVLHVRFLQPISVDVSFFQHTVETSLMADRKKLDNGWSPQELYIKSNPNLLMNDFTNPRNWYNSAAQRNILKSINRSQNDTVNINNKSSYFPESRVSKENVLTQLPRINTQERISGSKSAENSATQKPFEFQKTLLRRGPSFDEVTTKLRKKTPLNLVERAFPESLGKSVTWPSGSQIETKRYINKSSKRFAESNQDASRISLPPLNPDTGHPFLPHLPPHQPWVSSNQGKHKKLSITERNQNRTGSKQLDDDLRRDLSMKTDEDQCYKYKIEKWFKQIASGVANDTEPRLVNQQVNNNNPYNISAGAHPTKQDRFGSKHRKDVTKILLPDLKDSVQYSAVLRQLRTDKKGKADEKTEINREEYKLKQRSSLHLKMLDSVSKGDEDKSRGQLTKVNVDKRQLDESATSQDTDAGKKKKDKIVERKRRNTRADRHTGLNFLLARLPEDTDNEEYTTDDLESMDGAQELNNNSGNQTYYHPGHVFQTVDSVNVDIPPSGLQDPKPAVVNLVLSNERPPERKPLHIELSMKKIADRKIQQSENNGEAKSDPNVISKVAQDSIEDKAQVTNEENISPIKETVSQCDNTKPDERQPTITPANNGLSNNNDNTPKRRESENLDSGLIKETSDDNRAKHKENNGDLCVNVENTNGEMVSNEGGKTRSKHSTESNADDIDKREDSDTAKVSNSQSTCTSTFTAAYKNDKSALSKYNKLELFRDKSQPNIVLPTGSQQLVKPACNEWTHPPTYKLDLRNYDGDKVTTGQTEQTTQLT